MYHSSIIMHNRKLLIINSFLLCILFVTTGEWSCYNGRCLLTRAQTVLGQNHCASVIISMWFTTAETCSMPCFIHVKSQSQEIAYKGFYIIIRIDLKTLIHFDILQNWLLRRGGH